VSSVEAPSFHYAIALTGGIASGKSSVASIFREKGFIVIDADRIAHRILDEAAKEIGAHFGAHLLRGGGVDRKALGAIVFHSPEKRKVLERLLHPRIYAEILQLAHREEVKKEPYLIDLPLFFETARYNIEKIIVVYAKPEQQIERGMWRNGLSREEMIHRMAAQIPIEEKCHRASYLIDNTREQSECRKETLRTIETIRKDFL